MEKLIYSLNLVFWGVSAGYVIQVLAVRGVITLGIPILALRKRLQATALLFFNPIAILGATWVAGIDSVRIAALPFLGIAALVSGGLLAYAGSKVFAMNRKQTGAYIVCGGFTNIGSLGALFCFIFLGEAGFALVPFYKLFEEFSYYAIGFPMARSFSDDASGQESILARLKTVASDKFVLVAVGSIAAGLILNLSGIQRPQFYGTVNAIFVPLAAFLLLVSIGMAMRFSSVGKYLKQGLFLALIKFVMVPFAIVSAGFFLGLGNMDAGLPLKVVLILSSMPVGFIAMVPPTI
ncbi:MAG: hypothetical protein V1793_15410, partial [Pseudomonadota bacterium]